VCRFLKNRYKRQLQIELDPPKKIPFLYRLELGTSVGRFWFLVRLPDTQTTGSKF
jgi:hypothetical protein